MTCAAGLHDTTQGCLSSVSWRPKGAARGLWFSRRRKRSAPNSELFPLSCVSPMRTKMWIFFQVLWDRGTKRGGRGAAAQDGEKVCGARRSDSNCECHLNKAVLEERFCGVGAAGPRRRLGRAWSGGTFRCGRCSEMSRWSFHVMEAPTAGTRSDRTGALIEKSEIARKRVAQIFVWRTKLCICRDVRVGTTGRARRHRVVGDCRRSATPLAKTSETTFGL